MAKGVLALTLDGRLTFCTASEENRGKGRCNHVAHQKLGQSSDDFINSISENIKVEDNEIVDQMPAILNLVSQYGNSKNPEWKKIIEELDNPFNIGSESEGTYEEAKLVDFNQSLIKRPEGDTLHLTAKYEFRGRIYDFDYGEVPAVNQDGTITMDGVKWRVLPVLEQNKAGVVSYYNNIVLKNKDGRNISLSMNRDPEDDTVIIYGKPAKIEDVQNFLKNGDTSGLNSGQIYALKDIDPICYERFPDLKENLKQLKDLPVDEPGDLQWRRCIRYEDIVKDQMRLQMRRVGVTFRMNLGKRKRLEEENAAAGLPPIPEEELDKKYPLFYQYNLTENIKSELVSRSNVQFADNLNPIAALSQSQKISYTGPGGFHKDKAPYDLRMPHNSYKNLIDPMDISSGKNVGLTGTLSMGYIGDDRLIHYKDKSKSLSPSDFIPYKENDDPSRGIMAIAHMKQACPITGGEDPIVKTPAWDKIKGSKLGVNLPIAYVSCEGVFEDGVIISESASKKMTTIQSQKYEIKNKKDLSNLKVGQEVRMKDVVGGTEIKVGGTIKSVNDNSFEVETVYKMTVGNKIAGRHGNKSVVSKVLPDDQMPKIIQDGKEIPAQIVMSPLSVVGRKNLGQIRETNEAAGHGNGINYKSVVINPDGSKIEATAGVQYIMRLNHIAEKKISSHADELTAKREPQGARLGEMESLLLSTNKERLQILDYLRHQESYDSHKKLHSLLKSIGVELTGVNWDRK